MNKTPYAILSSPEDISLCVAYGVSSPVPLPLSSIGLRASTPSVVRCPLGEDLSSVTISEKSCKVKAKIRFVYPDDTEQPINLTGYEIRYEGEEPLMLWEESFPQTIRFSERGDSTSFNVTVIATKSPT